MKIDQRRLVWSWTLVIVALLPDTAATRSQPRTGAADAAVAGLALANQILANEGVLDGYGHVSVRDPDNPARYYLNLNARLQLQAMQLAGDRVTYLDPEEARQATQDYERSWDFWRKSRLPRK